MPNLQRANYFMQFRDELCAGMNALCFEPPYTHTQINFLCCMRSSRIVFTTWCDENHKRNLPKTFPIFHNAESTQHFRIEHNLPYNLMLLSTSPSEFFAMHRYEPMSSCWNLRMVSVIRLSYMECKCSCTLYLADDTIISPAVWVPFERRFPDYGMAWYGSKEKKKKRKRGENDINWIWITSAYTLII